MLHLEQKCSIIITKRNSSVPLLKGDIKMTENERIIHNEKMIKLAKQAGASVLEYDDGLIVGYGTDSDYDTHAVDISNGLGYYDNDGYYRSF